MSEEDKKAINSILEILQTMSPKYRNTLIIVLFMELEGNIDLERLRMAFANMK